MNTKKPMSLTSRVILGMVAGILTGFAIRTLFADNGFVDAYIVNGLFEVGGQIFVASLKMLVVPLVFVSLVCGTSSLKDLSTLGRMGGKNPRFLRYDNGYRDYACSNYGYSIPARGRGRSNGSKFIQISRSAIFGSGDH